MTQGADPRCGQVFGAVKGLPLVCDRPLGHTGTHRVGSIEPEPKVEASPPDSQDYEGGGP